MSQRARPSNVLSLGLSELNWETTAAATLQQRLSFRFFLLGLRKHWKRRKRVRERGKKFRAGNGALSNNSNRREREREVSPIMTETRSLASWRGLPFSSPIVKLVRPSASFPALRPSDCFSFLPFLGRKGGGGELLLFFHLQLELAS